MRYHQLTSEERNALSALRKQGLSQAAIGRQLGRHPRTIGRELRRNSRRDGGYRPFMPGEMTRGRRSPSRRNWRFDEQDWALVRSRLALHWSPEQIAGRLRRVKLLTISHETIYRYIWHDKHLGGSLYLCLRGARKNKWKRYRSYDNRGRTRGKRAISERPAAAENRSRVGHLEGDTVIGAFDRHCILTLVDRTTGYVMIGKLFGRTTAATNRRAAALIRNAPRRTLSLTVDNGTEFHGCSERTPAETAASSHLRSSMKGRPLIRHRCTSKLTLDRLIPAQDACGRPSRSRLPDRAVRLIPVSALPA